MKHKITLLEVNRVMFAVYAGILSEVSTNIIKTLS